MRRILLLAVLGTLLFACSDYSDDPSIVRHLQVLAIAAEPPEAQPGDSVQLTSLIADPKGGGRAISGAFSVCLPLLLAPSSNLVSESECVAPANQLALGVGTSLTITLPTNLLDGVSPAQRDAGIDFPVVLQATAGRESSWALARVRVSTNPVPNRNPAVGSVRIDGTDPGASTVTKSWGSPIELVGTVGVTDTGDVFERFTWFVTAGGFGDNNQSYDGDPAQWRTGGKNKPAGATLYGVSYDGRGGIAWAVRTVSF